MPNKEFFSNDPSGTKKRLSYLIKYPDILSDIKKWAKTYNLEDLSFYEQIYHYSNDLTDRPIDQTTGLLKVFRGPKKDTQFMVNLVILSNLKLLMRFLKKIKT